MRYGARKILIIIVVVMLWYQSFPFIALIERASTASISSKFHAACRRVPDVSLVLCCWKTKTDAVCYFENVSIHRTNLEYCGKSPKIRFHSYFHFL